MKNTISILDGTIIINKAKLDRIVSVFTYSALYFARFLLYIAIGIFAFLTIISGGDGKLNKGDPMEMFISFGLTIFCGFCARLVTILMNMVEHGYRVRRIRRKHAYINAHKSIA